MKKLLTSALALIIAGTPILASAQNTVSVEETFDSIFAALIVPEGSGWAKWEAVEKIKGVNWQWPLDQRSQHDHTMKGTRGGYMEVEIAACGYYDLGEFTEPPCLGKVSISSAYGENFPDTEYISIDYSNHLNDQLTKIPTTCDSDAATHQEAFYEWIKPGYTSLYIHYMSSSGSRMGNEDYNIAYVLDDILHPYPNPCKVLQ